MIIHFDTHCTKCLKELEFEKDIYEAYGWIRCKECGYEIQISWSFSEK